MDPISILGTVAGVASTGTQMSLSLYELAGRIKHAPREMIAIAQEMQTLSSTLNSLQEQLSENPTLFRQQIYEDTDTILSRLQVEQDAVLRLVKRNSGVHRLRWAFQKSDASVILCKIEGLKTLLNVVLQVASMQIAIHHRKETKAAKAEPQEKNARLSRFRRSVEAAVEASRQTIKDMPVQEAILELNVLENDLEEAYRVGDFQAAAELEDYAIPDQEHRISQLETGEDSLTHGVPRRDGELFKFSGPIHDTATFLYNLIFASPPAYGAPQQAHQDMARGGSSNGPWAAKPDVSSKLHSALKYADSDRRPDRAQPASFNSIRRTGTDETSASLPTHTVPVSIPSKPNPETATGVVDRLLLGWTTMSPDEVKSSSVQDMDSDGAQSNPLSTRPGATGGIDIEDALGNGDPLDEDMRTRGGVKFNTRPPPPPQPRSSRIRSRSSLIDRARGSPHYYAPYPEPSFDADYPYGRAASTHYPRRDQSGFHQRERYGSRDPYNYRPTRLDDDEIVRESPRGDRGGSSRSYEPWAQTGSEPRRSYEPWAQTGSDPRRSYEPWVQTGSNPRPSFQDEKHISDRYALPDLEVERRRTLDETERLEERLRREDDIAKREWRLKMDHDQLKKATQKIEAEELKQRAAQEFAAKQEEAKRTEENLRLEIRREIKEEADKEDMMRFKMMRELEGSGRTKSDLWHPQSHLDREGLPSLRSIFDFQVDLVAQLLAQNKSMTWLAITEIQARALSAQRSYSGSHQALAERPAPVIAALRSPPQSATSRDDQIAEDVRRRGSGEVSSTHKAKGRSLSGSDKSVTSIDALDEKRSDSLSRLIASSTEVDASAQATSTEDRVRSKKEADETPEIYKSMGESTGILRGQGRDDGGSNNEPVEELPAVGLPPENVELLARDELYRLRRFDSIRSE